MKNLGRTWKYFFILLGLTLMTFLVLGFNSRMAEHRRLSTEAERVELRVTELVQTQIDLKEKIAYATSEPAVVRWALEDGRWVRPGDELIVPLPAVESTPAPQPVPVVTQQPVHNWDAWLALFFDEAPRTP
jgi:sensor c-di-GMP phosphodiesterase-like protein